MTQILNLKSQKKGKLIIFSAPSGAGKTTIVKHLLQQNFNLEFSISATSRQPRHTETDGKDYYFLTEKEFQKKVENNDFLEWEEVYKGVKYGTLKSDVERIRNLGKNVIFDVDVVGGLNIKKYFGNKALAIFVQPPSIKALQERLHNRSTDTKEVIETRIAKAKHELSFAPQFDVVITNNKLKDALAKTEKIIGEFLEK
jgi:guanylate kinase